MNKRRTIKVSTTSFQCVLFVDLCTGGRNHGSWFAGELAEGEFVGLMNMSPYAPKRQCPDEVVPVWRECLAHAIADEWGISVVATGVGAPRNREYSMKEFTICRAVGTTSKSSFRAPGGTVASTTAEAMVPPNEN